MKKYNHIVCPIDFSDSSEKTLQQALEFRDMANSRLTVVHFVEPFPAIAYSMGTVDMGQGMFQSAEQNMEEIIKKFDLDRADTKIERDYPKYAISAYTKELDGDLIVIGSHGHHSFIGGLVGSTASATVNNASCDVFVVR